MPKKKSPETKELGRPRKPFNWQLVDEMASMYASELYIAECLLVSESVYVDKNSLASKIRLMQRRIRERYGVTFVEFRDQKQELAKIELRGLQWKSARLLNATMLIWLGKQLLGQRDKFDDEKSNLTPVEPSDQKMTPEDFLRRLDKEKEAGN